MSESVGIISAFDDLRAGDVRFIEEASRFGPVTACITPDEMVERQTGMPPKFPLHERIYLLERVRFVSRVIAMPPAPAGQVLPAAEQFGVTAWADNQNADNKRRGQFCREAGLHYIILSPQQLAGFPQLQGDVVRSDRKRVVVTGCYDWFHSGHVRFFEEVSSYGDLYVIVGHDANIRLLKGDGHPLVPQEERRYMVSAIRFVTQALVSSGAGWLDADPEIQKLKPDIYAVNEDGDRGGKREYCASRGIEYLVLKRRPAPGLPARTSTSLRGY